MLDLFENISLLDKDRQLLDQTKIPIVTVAASFRDELARFHGVEDYFGYTEDEVLFSRAHFSMALAAVVASHKGGATNPANAWLVDPTNYVTRHDWTKVVFTEEVGRLMARNGPLKWFKDQVDSRVRQKLPITGAITTPLLYLFEHVTRPILSFHYEAGNILGAQGKIVVQVVTDPHVRPQYLEHAELPTMRFCVFDDKTKMDFLELADVLGKDVDSRRVIVTGPPVDPRIAACRKQKVASAMKHRALRLVIATGGLGTNKQEIEACIRSLAPFIRGNRVQVVVYAGVHEDLRESIHHIASQEGLSTADRREINAPLRILHSPHIVEANELLIKYAFPWADGFITKPSGDMAYDAAAAGCFVLTLEPWGEWEHNIRDVFEQRGVSRRAIPEGLANQLDSLLVENGTKSWAQLAIEKALDLPNDFIHGIDHILAQMPN